MSREEDVDPESISKYSKILNDSGYYSIMTVYTPTLPDFIVKIANIIDPQHTLKYMQAIRTYAISPEYMAMICEAFNEIAYDRLMLNIISGDIKSNENFINEIVFIKDMIDTPEKRLIYTEEWLKKFNSNKLMSKKPEIMMAGHSKKTKQMALDNNYIHGSSLDMYLRDYNTENHIVNPKQLASMLVAVLPNEEETKKYLNALKENEKFWSVVGTKEQVKEKILNLNKMGISDFMFTAHADDDKNAIHGLVKELTTEMLNIAR